MKATAATTLVILANKFEKEAKTSNPRMKMKMYLICKVKLDEVETIIASSFNLKVINHLY